VVGSCEDGNETYCFIKGGEYVQQVLRAVTATTTNTTVTVNADVSTYVAALNIVTKLHDSSFLYENGLLLSFFIYFSLSADVGLYLLIAETVGSNPAINRFLSLHSFLLLTRSRHPFFIPSYFFNFFLCRDVLVQAYHVSRNETILITKSIV
jgi:hypothetical protein